MSKRVELRLPLRPYARLAEGENSCWPTKRPINSGTSTRVRSRLGVIETNADASQIGGRRDYTRSDIAVDKPVYLDGSAMIEIARAIKAKKEHALPVLEQPETGPRHMGYGLRG